MVRSMKMKTAIAYFVKIIKSVFQLHFAAVLIHVLTLRYVCMAKNYTMMYVIIILNAFQDVVMAVSALIF